MKCPKCGYERQAADNAPDGECPSCGIVYAKYKPPNQLTIPHDNPSDILEKRYKAILGEINQEYYLTKFKQFDQQGTGLKRSWNWPAFFFHVNWFLYRKMYGLFFIFFFSVSIIFAPIDMLARIAIEKSLWGGFLMLPILLIPQLFYGIFGNSLYHKHIKKKIAAAQLTIKDEARLLEHIGRGVNKWVIWLGWAIIILAVVIGILAAIIIPQFSAKKHSKQTEVSTTSSSVFKKPTEKKYLSEEEAFAPPTKPNPFDQFDKKPATEQVISGEEMLGLPPKSQSATTTANEWRAKAGELEKKMDWPGLLNHALIWSQALPGDADARYNIGLAYGESGQIVKAIEFYQQAVSINSEHVNAWYHLGLAYGNSSQSVKEIEAYQQVTRINPEDSNAWYHLGNAYRKSNQTVKEIEAYQQVTRINPEDSNARDRLNFLLLR